MKINVILKTVVVILFTALLSVGNMIGQTSVSKLTPAQIAARQAQLEQNIQLIMPPPISPAITARIQANKAKLAKASPMDGGVSPMDSQQGLPPTYAVIDLGALSGYVSSASGINNTGQVVGNSGHAFLWQNGIMRDIGTLPGSSFGYANGINNNGQVVGYSSTNGDSIPRAFLYQNGSMKSLGTLGGTNWTVAYSINDNCQIVGYSPNSGGSEHAFLWQNGSMQDLGTLLGSSGFSLAYGINNKAQVVGASLSAKVPFPLHAFLYQNGSMHDIGTLGGDTSSAWAINNNGQIVGDSLTSNNVADDAFLYQNGSMQDLGRFPGSTENIACSINDSGQIVGYAYANNSFHPLLYYGTVMYDLNNLIVTNSGWILVSAECINNSGQIVGGGINPAGQDHAFLLNPLPFGSVTAATAVQTNLPVYPKAPIKGTSDEGLVVITHGIIYPADYSKPEASTTWVDTMSNSIAQYLHNNGLNNWRVIGIKWIAGAFTPNPGTALNNANQIGKILGNDITAKGWTNVHFIAHSAGSELIESAAEEMRISSLIASTPLTIQCTFLDPYVGSTYEEANSYGQAADWSDCYLADDWTGNWTGMPLANAYNVNVTTLDPSAAKQVPGYVSSSDLTSPCYQVESSHGWPVTFYQNSITNPPSYDGFGFPLSMEGGGWAKAINLYKIGDGVSYGSMTNLGPVYSSCISRILADAIKVIVPDFSASSTWQSQNGTVTTSSGFAGLTADSTPAWVSIVVTPTNSVNLLSFDADFASVEGGRGLLSVYWDTNLLGLIDEAAVNTGLQHYSLPMPISTVGTSHVLGFHLDPFTSADPNTTITNIEVDASGITQQPVLSVTNTASGRVYQLVGQPDSYYIQATTNLIGTNWVNIAILQNITGTAEFMDPSATNYPIRFYRAVAQ